MKHKFSVSLVLALIMAMLVTAVAVADDVSNNLDASVDAVAEIMSLNVGGTSGFTDLYTVNRNGDGKNGCNLTGSTTLVVDVVNSNPAVATVSPTQITFTGCENEDHNVSTGLTVTPVSAGSTTISLSLVSNNSAGSFNLAPATFTVNVVPPPNTPPQVSITGVNGGESYEIGSVPAAICEVTDAEDGNSTFPATLSAVSGSLAVYGLGEQTASCEYTDGGGMNASASVTYGIVDTTAPVITFVSRTPANANGWNNDDVTVEWSCSDSGSGVVAATVTQTVSTEGENQSVDGTCEDHAGNKASDTHAGINIDKTAPTASASASPAPNTNGWNNTDVTVSFSGTDELSGIDFCATAVILSTEGAGQSASGTCTDKAGNVSASAAASGINIDKTAPTVSLVGGPAHGGAYYFSFVPAAPTCSASDALSGLDGSCLVSGYSDALGDHTVSASATDKAGNSASTSTSYTVLAWTLNGFYQPVDMNGVWNTVKGGSTVPFKFEVFAGPLELTDTFVVSSFVASPVACPLSTAVADAIEFTTTGGTSLRYDLVAGQFINNWQTPKKPGACYVVTMTTRDGSSLSANFKLK